MKAIGFTTRALVIEALAVGAIIWFAGGEIPGFENAARGNLSHSEAVEVSATSVDRPALVQSKLERFASALRSAANQFVDETLATCFDK